MEDPRRRQAGNPRPTRGCKDPRECNRLTQVDLLGSASVCFPDVLDSIQPEVVAAGLRKRAKILRTLPQHVVEPESSYIIIKPLSRKKNGKCNLSKAAQHCKQSLSFGSGKRYNSPHRSAGNLLQKDICFPGACARNTHKSGLVHLTVT